MTEATGKCLGKSRKGARCMQSNYYPVHPTSFQQPRPLVHLSRTAASVSQLNLSRYLMVEGHH